MAPKLGLGFGSVLILVVVLGLVSSVQLSRINSGTVDIATNWLPRVQAIAELRLDAAEVRNDTLNYMIATDKKQHYDDRIISELSAMADGEKKYGPLLSSDEERKLYQGFRDRWDKYLAVNTQVMELSRQNKTREAIDLAQSRASQLFEEATKYLQEGLEFSDKGVANAAKNAAEAYWSSRYWVVGISIGAIALGFIIVLTMRAHSPHPSPRCWP